MRNYEIEQIIYKIGLESLEHKNGKFHFRCSVCGDSSHSQRKKRGWIIEKNGNYHYHCFNCGYSANISNYLKQYHYELYKEYLSLIIFKKEFDKPVIQNKILKTEYEKLNIPNILSLDENHRGRKYISERKIPFKFWNNIYFTYGFKKFVNTLIPNKFESTDYDDERIVIPIYDIHKKIIGIQGRSLEKKAKIRYLTILFNDDDLNICGLERVSRTDTIYITEGFFDSLFLPNAISMNSSNIPLNRLNEISNKENFVFVFDNEKRNRQIIQRMEKVIDNGFKILIWPDGIKGKDINEMLEFYKNEEIIKIIENNIYSGMTAKLKLKMRFL